MRSKQHILRMLLIVLGTTAIDLVLYLGQGGWNEAASIVTMAAVPLGFWLSYWAEVNGRQQHRQVLERISEITAAIAQIKLANLETQAPSVPLAGTQSSENQINLDGLLKELAERLERLQWLEEALIHVPDPQEVQSLLRLAKAYEHLGRWADVIHAFDRIITLDPKDPRYYYNRGNARFEQSSYREAEQDFAEAITLDPKEPGYYSNRGNARFRQGSYREAEQDYTEAIALDPKEPGYYSNRSIARSRQGHFVPALTDASYAIQLAPDNPKGYVVRGWLNLRHGDTKAAVKDVGQALVLDPADGEAHGIAGECLLAMGRHEEAASEFELAESYGFTKEHWEHMITLAQLSLNDERFQRPTI